MKRYILVSVCENKIMTGSFSDLSEAQLQMMTEFCDAANLDLHDCSDPEWQDDECCYDQCSAEVYDGTNHDNYAWLIIDSES